MNQHGVNTRRGVYFIFVVKGFLYKSSYKAMLFTETVDCWRLASWFRTSCSEGVGRGQEEKKDSILLAVPIRSYGHNPLSYNIHACNTSFTSSHNHVALQTDTKTDGCVDAEEKITQRFETYIYG